MFRGFHYRRDWIGSFSRWHPPNILGDYVAQITSKRIAIWKGRTQHIFLIGREVYPKPRWRLCPIMFLTFALPIKPFRITEMRFLVSREYFLRSIREASFVLNIRRTWMVLRNGLLISLRHQKTSPSFAPSELSCVTSRRYKRANYYGVKNSFNLATKYFRLLLTELITCEIMPNLSSWTHALLIIWTFWEILILLA